MNWANRYKHIIYEASEGIIIADRKGTIIDANHYIEKMCDCDLKELKKRDFFEIVQCENEEHVKFFNTGEREETSLFEACLVKQNAQPISVEVSAKRFADGGIATFIRDITERRKILEALRYHSYLLENLKDAVIITDKDYRIVMWNKGAEALYGWTEAEVKGKRPLQVIKTDLDNICVEEVKRVLHKEGRWVSELVQFTKEGEQKYIFSSVELVRNERGEITGSISINIDISEKMNYEKKLQQHYKSLKEIAWIQSHKVRAPLSNILGIVKLLGQEKEVKENSDLLLQHLRSSAQQLDDVIREITALTIFDSKE